ncbi:MAG: thioredoxin [Chitinophagaceae bacterium]|nr:thioredoxin [Chitinophagaceae bacterium]MCW5926462.1 thioredoxin [Chitinophagaceae bacterium]
MRTRLFIVILLLGCLNAYAQRSRLLQPAEFKKSLDSIKHPQVVDVRTPEEFQTGFIEGARNIDIYDAGFLQQLQSLDRNLPVMVYCKGGGRSADAARQLEKMGFKEVYDLAGGIMLWENKGLPVVAGIPVTKANKFVKADFDSLLLHHPKILVDFYGPWCGPCKQMEPSLSYLSKKYKGKITVYRLNIDEARMLTKELQVEAIPVLAIYHNGKELKRVSGYQTSGQLKKLAKTLARR